MGREGPRRGRCSPGLDGLHQHAWESPPEQAGEGQQRTLSRPWSWMGPMPSPPPGLLRVSERSHGTQAASRRLSVRSKHACVPRSLRVEALGWGRRVACCLCLQVGLRGGLTSAPSPRA